MYDIFEVIENCQKAVFSTRMCRDADVEERQKHCDVIYEGLEEIRRQVKELRKKSDP